MELTDPQLRRRVLAEFIGQNDRTCTIVAGSILETQLEQLLRKKLLVDPPKELFAPYGPLSTFAAKIDMSTAMGYISKSESADLHVIRKIRNTFSHSLEEGLQFSSAIVRNHMKALHYCRSKITGLKTSARGDFETSVLVLLGFLLGKIEKATHVKATVDPKDTLHSLREKVDSDSAEY